MSLSDICINYTDGSISFSTNNNIVTEPTNPNDDSIVIYKESFERGLDEYYVESIMGTKIWETYKKGALILNPASIPEATDGNSILMLYVPKSESPNESRFVSPYIKLTHGGEYILSFDIYCDAKTALQEYSFNLIVEDESGICASFVLEKATNGWSKVSIPISSASKNIRYIIKAVVSTGGIFVDNIYLMSNNSTGIKFEKEEQHNNNDRTYIYSINGYFMGEKK